MNWIDDLVRPDLCGLHAYSSARSEAGGFAPDIGLDANEFPWPPFGVASSFCSPHKYPEFQPKLLIEKVAALWGIEGRNIYIGRGSDEGIDLLMRLFCSAGRDQIIVCPPTYGMYEVAAKVQCAECLKVPLKDYGQICLDSVSKAVSDKTKLIFIPSPNAPMGHLMNRADIFSICEMRKDKSLIVVDEAYAEFSNAPRGYLDEIQRYKNLVILRTFSKAHALAGERIGFVIAVEAIIEKLRLISPPYPLSQTSIRAALDVLSPSGRIQNAQRTRQILSERERLFKALQMSPHICKVFPSQANFLLAIATDAESVMNLLKSYGILARDRSRDIKHAIRISIGSAEENDAVLRALGVDDANISAATFQRIFSISRKTKETDIAATVNLDSTSFVHANTGIGFFDHMIEQIATHGGFGVELSCKGDLHVDPHHTIEDVALVLGDALKQALGDKTGLARFGFSAPLDEALAQVTLDLSGRPCLIFSGDFDAEFVGPFPTEMTRHFFQSFANALGASVHMKLKGENAHHMIEAAFKATGRALRQAFSICGNNIPSTKGVL